MLSASRSSLLPALLLAALPAVAQTNNTIIDRANQGAPSPTTPAPGLDAPPAAPGADTDAGTQRVAEPRRLPVRLTASFDEQLYVASNVFLTPNDNAVNDTGALVSTTTIALGADTLPVVVGEGRLVFSAAIVWQRFLHGLATSNPDIEALDFDSYSLPLGATYSWGRGWEAAASIAVGSLYSIGDSPSHELLYRNHTPSLALRKLTRLSDGLLLSLGGGISYSDTDASLHGVPAPALFGYREDRNDRVDASLSAALYAFDGPWTFSPSLRIAHGHYIHWQEAGFVDQDRDDLTASLGLTVSYAFADWGTARAFATYDIRESSGASIPGADYDYSSGTAGLGLSLALRF